MITLLTQWEVYTVHDHWYPNWCRNQLKVWLLHLVGIVVKRSIIIRGWNSIFINSAWIRKFWTWLHKSLLICSLYIVLRQTSRLYATNLYYIFPLERRTLYHNGIIPTLSRYTNSAGIEWSIELENDINILLLDGSMSQYVYYCGWHNKYRWIVRL